MENKTQEALKMAIEALEQAKEKLEKYWNEDINRWYDIEDMDDSHILLCGDTINACKKALEPDRTEMVYYKNNACKAKDAKTPDCICWTPKQSAQEPVEVYGILDDGDYVSVEATKEGAIKQCDFMNKHDCNCTYKPLYTHPHQWQGLTDDEIDKLSDDTLFEIGFNGLGIKAFARAIEQASAKKNGFEVA